VAIAGPSGFGAAGSPQDVPWHEQTIATAVMESPILYFLIKQETKSQDDWGIYAIWKGAVSSGVSKSIRFHMDRRRLSIMPIESISHGDEHDVILELPAGQRTTASQVEMVIKAENMKCSSDKKWVQHMVSTLEEKGVLKVGAVQHVNQALSLADYGPRPPTPPLLTVQLKRKADSSPGPEQPPKRTKT